MIKTNYYPAQETQEVTTKILPFTWGFPNTILLSRWFVQLERSRQRISFARNLRPVLVPNGTWFAGHVPSRMALVLMRTPIEHLQVSPGKRMI